MTSFGSHFRQTTWGRLSALTFCCTESLVSKADVTEQLQQALSLCALPKTNNMAAKKNLILEKVHSSKSNHSIYFYFWANCLNKESTNIFLNRFDSKKKIQLYLKKKKSTNSLTFVTLATLSWTCNQTSEDIPAGESRITVREGGTAQ